MLKGRWARFSIIVPIIMYAGSTNAPLSKRKNWGIERSKNNGSFLIFFFHSKWKLKFKQAIALFNQLNAIETCLRQLTLSCNCRGHNFAVLLLLTCRGKRFYLKLIKIFFGSGCGATLIPWNDVIFEALSQSLTAKCSFEIYQLESNICGRSKQ